MEIIIGEKVKFLTSDKLGDVKHGFSLRYGGVSEGEYDALNLGLRRGDDPFNVFKNIEICADALKLTKKNLTLTNQLHTDNVKILTGEDIGKGLFREWGEGVDAVVTNMKNVPIMCYSADCVPTLLYDGVKKVIGAVHGGWRGTRENIVGKAVAEMVKLGSEACNIRAFVGPCIGDCCYEVSEDVAEEFLPRYDKAVTPKCAGKYMLNLKLATKMQLENAMLIEDNIDISRYCTSCNNDMFFSHRRQNGKSGLLGGFIQLD